jgi:hypothetical protein
MKRPSLLDAAMAFLGIAAGIAVVAHGFTKMPCRLDHPPSIEDVLVAQRDSLEALLAQVPLRDTIYITKYRTIRLEADSVKKEVQSRPMLGQVDFLAESIGFDSLEITPDSLTLLPLLGVQRINGMLIEGQEALTLAGVMEDHLAAKDTAIRLMAARLLNEQQMRAQEGIRYETAAIKTENTVKILTKVTLAEGLIILLLALL